MSNVAGTEPVAPARVAQAADSQTNERNDMTWNQTVKTALVALAIAAGLALTVIAGKELVKEEKVDWQNVPAAVQATITANANGGTVIEVEKEIEKGAVVYEAEVKGADGKKFDVQVAADGRLIKSEADEADEVNDQETDDDED
jgi:uncharacterized membrane protein YkoI